MKVESFIAGGYQVAMQGGNADGTFSETRTQLHKHILVLGGTQELIQKVLLMVTIIFII